MTEIVGRARNSRGIIERVSGAGASPSRSFAPHSACTLLLGALALLNPSGCFTGEAALALPCEVDNDCGRGQSCVEGICAVTGSRFCGDGQLEEGEECDDGAENAPGAPCTPECTVNVCGDGYVGPGEACDDGASNGADECTPVCTVNFCGDGYVGPDESCDSDDPTQCTATCDRVFFSDDMEAPKAGWEDEVASYPADHMSCADSNFCFKSEWIQTANVSTLENHPDAGGSTRAWYSGDLSTVQGSSSSRLISPPIDLQAATGAVTLGFYHHYKFKEEIGMTNFFSDGALVEVSVEGGPWEPLELPGYVAEVSDKSMCTVKNPLLRREAFVGRSGVWLREVGALDAYAGKTIRLGFQIGSDCLSLTQPVTKEDSEVEWYLDNLVISGPTVAADGG